MPFLHIYPNYVYLSDDGDVDIMNENRDGYMTTKNDFLALGKYAYIGHRTLFRVFLKTTRAFQVKQTEFCATPVDTDDILPPISSDQGELRTMSVQILLNSDEHQQLLSKLYPTTIGQVSMAQQSEPNMLQLSKETISVPINSVLTNLPEIAQTKALCASIKAYFNKDFIINEIDATKGQHNLCKYSTCHPDVCFYHTANYFYDSKVVAAVAPTIPSEESESDFEPNTDSHVHSGTLYRASGEDKTHSASKGQGQLVAAMMLTATTIGKVAISKNQFFTKAVIFGFTRQTSDNTSVIFRMEMDFESQETRLYKGKDPVDTATLLLNLKALLEKPNLIKPVS